MRAMCDQQRLKHRAELEAQARSEIILPGIGVERNVKEYLLVLLRKEDRWLFTRIRLGLTELGVEIGRHHGIKPRERRVCRICDKSIVEDHVHVLGGCYGRDDVVALRKTFLFGLRDSFPAHKALRPSQWDSRELWIRLFNSSDPELLLLLITYARDVFTIFCKDRLPRFLSLDELALLNV